MIIICQNIAFYYAGPGSGAGPGALGPALGNPASHRERKGERARLLETGLQTYVNCVGTRRRTTAIFGVETSSEKAEISLQSVILTEC